MPGIGDKTMKKLIEAGFDSIEKLAEASVETLSELPGIGEKTAARILSAARGEERAGGDTETEEQ